MSLLLDKDSDFCAQGFLRHNDCIAIKVGIKKLLIIFRVQKGQAMHKDIIENSYGSVLRFEELPLEIYGFNAL